MNLKTCSLLFSLQLPTLPVHSEYACNAGDVTSLMPFTLNCHLPPSLVPGDTLFALGCGRLFEGDPPTMWASLSKLLPLPRDTLVLLRCHMLSSNLCCYLSHCSYDHPQSTTAAVVFLNCRFFNQVTHCLHWAVVVCLRATRQPCGLV
jgi:hypothetical protein